MAGAGSRLRIGGDWRHHVGPSTAGSNFRACAAPDWIITVLDGFDPGPTTKSSQSHWWRPARIPAAGDRIAVTAVP
jgi:hypothetical protein